jgi:hypothetical protein
MITKGKQNTTHDGVSIGSTIRQNIVEKLPVINTQVKLNEKKQTEQRNFAFFVRQRRLLI